MEMIVSVPHVWGNVPCVVLPALKPPPGSNRRAEDPDVWEAKNLKWIQKMAALSKPVDPEAA